MLLFPDVRLERKGNKKYPLFIMDIFLFYPQGNLQKLWGGRIKSKVVCMTEYLQQLLTYFIYKIYAGKRFYNE